jgi:hypothetical protein
MPGSFVPNVVRDWIGLIAQSSRRLGEGESDAFGIGEVWGVVPSCYGEEAFIGFASVLKKPRMHV